MEKKVTCCFAGTRNGMTERQKLEVERLFKELGVTTVYHGGAVGADEEASLIAQRLGINIRGFPGNIESDRSKLAHADAWEKPAAALSRNKAMVKRAHLVIAAPDGPEKPRSATWSTIRFAKAEGKKLLIVEP
jgi:predicted Rossmann-fold nucleotide-binding protein